MDNIGNTLPLVIVRDTNDAEYAETVHYSAAYTNTMAERAFNALK